MKSSRVKYPRRIRNGIRHLHWIFRKGIRRDAGEQLSSGC